MKWINWMKRINRMKQINAQNKSTGPSCSWCEFWCNPQLCRVGENISSATFMSPGVLKVQILHWRLNYRVSKPTGGLKDKLKVWGNPLKLTTSIGSPQAMADWNLPQKPRKVGKSRPFGQRCRRQRTESWPKTIKPANPTTRSCSFFQASEEFILYIVNLL